VAAAHLIRLQAIVCSSDRKARWPEAGASGLSRAWNTCRGRAFYGLRRQATDLAPEFATDARVLNRLSGHLDSATRERSIRRRRTGGHGPARRRLAGTCVSSCGNRNARPWTRPR